MLRENKSTRYFNENGRSNLDLPFFVEVQVLRKGLSMLKLKAKKNNSQILIVCKLNRTQQIDEGQYAILSNKPIKGLMKPKQLSPRKIEYLSTSGVALRLFLRNQISLNDFYLVFAQVVEIAKVVYKNSLNLVNLIYNLDYSFINTHTNEVHMIYQPIATTEYVNRFPDFLCEIIRNTVLGNPQENAALNNLYNFITNAQNFSLELIENYILKTYPAIYKQIPRQKPGQSQMLKGDDLYYRQNSITLKKEKANMYAHSRGTVGNIGEEDTALLLDDDATSLLMEDEDTALLVEDDATSLLVEDDGTALLPQKAVSYPYLIRVMNYDRVDINKPVFRIGKERTYVDYFVQNNSAVSRLHADIIKKGEHFYLKDNNSTNGTFINEIEIPAEKEVEIFEGDHIVLANEEFEFHIN